MKNIAHIWSVVCSQSVTDEETKNISLLNLIERFNIGINKDQKKPDEGTVVNVGINFELVSRFSKKGEDKDISFDYQSTLITPNGKIIGQPNERTIAFRKGTQNIRIRTKFNEFPLISAGLYHVQVAYRETDSTAYEPAASIPIEIKIEEK